MGADEAGGYITNDRDVESLYFNGEGCAWLISVPAGSTIRFYFTKLDLETNADGSNGDECQYDWVSIYDGLRPSSAPLVTRQCSPSGVGKNFYTTQQYALVLFNTDESVQYEGFELRWLRQGPKTVGKQQNANFNAHCSALRVVDDNSQPYGGYIVNDRAQSDGLYLNNENCSWLIRSNEDSTILLYFSEMEMETDDNGDCYDWVAIYDGEVQNDSTLLTKQCFNGAIGQNFHTKSNKALVYFHTDNSLRYRGFKLHWLPQDQTPKHYRIGTKVDPMTTAPTPVCQPMQLINVEMKQGNDSGIIENNRNSDGQYFNNMRCGWQITVPNNGRIRFWFSEINLEFHGLFLD